MANWTPMLLAMLAILATWAWSIFILCGLGRFCMRRTPLGARANLASALTCGWIGISVVVGLAQIWHFFLRLDGWFATALSVLGLLGWQFSRNSAEKKQASPPRHWLLHVCIAAFAVFLANRATGPCDNIDTGLYHWNVIRWTTEHPIVPGLGNLHVRLGSNQSALLFAATFDCGPWYGRSNHVVSGLLILLLAAQGLNGLDRLRTGGRGVDLVDALLLPPAVAMANHWWISSHSTDVAAASSVLAATSLWLRRNERDATGVECPVAMILLTTAVCMKITALFVAVGLMLAAAYEYLANGNKPRPTFLRFGVVGAAAAGLLAPWLARGGVLSGYLLYPSTLLALPVDWRVPVATLAAENEHIRAFARVHNDAFEPSKSYLWQSWEWIPIWLRLLEREIVLPCIAIGCSATLLALDRALRPRLQLFLARPDQPLLLAASFALVAWFGTAPDTRFGFFLFWVALSAFAVGIAPRRPAMQRTLFAACIALTAVQVKKPYTAPSPHGLHPSAHAAMISVQTRRGAQVWMPVAGRLCHDATLPCTPHLDPDLENRKPNDLAGGYRIVR